MYAVAAEATTTSSSTCLSRRTTVIIRVTCCVSPVTRVTPVSRVSSLRVVNREPRGGGGGGLTIISSSPPPPLSCVIIHYDAVSRWMRNSVRGGECRAMFLSGIMFPEEKGGQRISKVCVEYNLTRILPNRFVENINSISTNK